MTRRRQTFNLIITTTSNLRPAHLLRRALRGQEDISEVQLTATGPIETLPTPNRERLIALAVWAAGEQAKKELGLPSEWGQGNWFTRTECGTACCIAGKVALEDGGVPVPREPQHGDWTATEAGQATSLVRFSGEDEAVPADEYARQALGLTSSQADRLFAGSNSLHAILAAIRDLLAETDEDDDDASTRRLNSAFHQEDEDAEPVTTRIRRLRTGITRPIHGPECNACYETVSESEDAEETQ